MERVDWASRYEKKAAAGRSLRPTRREPQSGNAADRDGRPRACRLGAGWPGRVARAALKTVRLRLEHRHYVKLTRTERGRGPGRAGRRRLPPAVGGRRVLPAVRRHRTGRRDRRLAAVSAGTGIAPGGRGLRLRHRHAPKRHIGRRRHARPAGRRGPRRATTSSPPPRPIARGHFESRALIRDRQPASAHPGRNLVGTARALIRAGSSAREVVGLARSAAARTFDATFPSRPMAWKDPRNCLVLPFWRSVLDPPVAAVLVYRDGLEVAQSLRTRTHLASPTGWPCGNATSARSCADLAGVPTFATDYGACSTIRRSPAGNWWDSWPTSASPWTPRGCGRPSIPSTRACATSDPRRADHRRSPTARTSCWPSCAGSRARTIPWRPPDLGAEPAWVEDVLSLRREYEVLERQLRSSRRGDWSRRGGSSGAPAPPAPR